MTHAAPHHPRSADPGDFPRLRADPVVRELHRRRRPVIGVAAIAIALYLFDAVVANTVPGLLAIRIVGPVNTGVGLGLLQCLTTLGGAGWYARYARTRIDPLREHAAAVIDRREERP